MCFMHEGCYPSTVDSGPPMSPYGLLVGGVNLHEHPELCRAGSDAANITADTPLPPTLVAHGTKNHTVECELSAERFEHLHTTGYDAELMLAKDADHRGSGFGFFR